MSRIKMDRLNSVNVLYVRRTTKSSPLNAERDIHESAIHASFWRKLASRDRCGLNETELQI